MCETTTTCSLSTVTAGRRRSMKKRYSNLAAAAAVAAAVALEEKEERRKSFALDVELIPSFHKLNGDALFEGGEEQPQPQPRPSRTSRRSGKERRPLRASQERRSGASIQIRETKVVVQRVGKGEDALFQDNSSHSLHTETTASCSTLSLSSPEDPFVTTNHFSCSALDFEFGSFEGDDDGFGVSPRRAKPLSSKYANLGTRLRERGARTTDDIRFVPPVRTPADLTPLAEAFAVPRRPKVDGSNLNPPRRSARRRSSLGDASDCQGKPVLTKGNSFMQKRSSEYKPLGGSPQWSLKNIVGQQRRSRQQQQEQMCQNFFGGH